jgi:hypothetical protein
MLQPTFGKIDSKLPQYRPVRLPRRTKAPGLGLNLGVEINESTATRLRQEVGPGPFSYMGFPASLPEWLVLRELMRLGWRPSFQVNFMAGRSLPGGQVLDVVLPDALPPVFINVQSYFHLGALQAYTDLVKRNMVQAAYPGARILDLWEEDIVNDRWLHDKLMLEVGPRGR